MPVKRTVNDGMTLKPAEAFYAMTGLQPIHFGVRCHGWLAGLELASVLDVEQLEAGDFSECRDVEGAIEGLRAEAKAHGFEPWIATGRHPSGAGFEAWRRAFLARHAY